MTIERPIANHVAPLMIFLCLVPLAVPRLSAQEGVYSGGLFELGDAEAPPGFPGMGNILLSPTQAGPDWEDIFDADGAWRDDDANGVPDFQEHFGGRWAFFAADDVSLGSGFESSALYPDGRIYNATVAADHDLGNAYAFLTTDSLGNVVVFVGAERLGGGQSHLEFELNQDAFQLGHGGFARGEPWEVLGVRVAGDVRIRVDFIGGQLATVSVESWDGGTWSPKESFSGEGCNLAETFCVICNGEVVEGGPWPNHDTSGDPEQIAANRFIEVGVNVGALLLGGPADYTTIWMRTPEDAAFGYFAGDN